MLESSKRQWHVLLCAVASILTLLPNEIECRDRTIRTRNRLIKIEPFAIQLRSNFQYQSCVDDLVASDLDGDKKVSEEEYVEFILSRSRGGIDVEKYADLPFPLISNFVYGSCFCSFVTRDPTCCVGDDAGISLAIDESPIIEQNLVTVCRTAGDAIASEIGTFPPTIAPTIIITDEPTASPTASPTSSPTASPTTSPTASPTTEEPTPGASSGDPTSAPEVPTGSPTPEATTEEPSSSPIVIASEPPTLTATSTPTLSPTLPPTNATATETPTGSPSSSPSDVPTTTPTMAPTNSTDAPTVSASGSPTVESSFSPTPAPTLSPTLSPSGTPTASPTDAPTDAPSATPTEDTDELVCVSFQYGIENEDGLDAADIESGFNNTFKLDLINATEEIVIDILNEGLSGRKLETDFDWKTAGGHRLLGVINLSDYGLEERNDNLRKREPPIERTYRRHLAYYSDAVSPTITSVTDNEFCEVDDESILCSIVDSTVCVYLEEGDSASEVKEQLLDGIKEAFQDGSFEEALA